MSRNLQRIILLLAVVIVSLCGNEARASHAMGADLTYECLGGNTYKVRLSFYRDCIGIDAPLNIYVNIRSVSCGQNLGVTCNPVPGTGQEVSYLCPTALSTCNGGTFTGIQEWVYEGIVTLPMQCTDWEFSYSLCCRNAAITTITNPGSNTFYIYARLNNTISPCNSSPTFSNKPVPFACLGQEMCFNHGAIDSDGDSLVYSLVNPQQTVSTYVSYINPYNATNPLASTPSLQFNPATGDVCFTPSQLQVTVMAVLVQEYRNGLLIGSVVRDIQVTVLNCNNDLPTLTGINGTNDFDLTVCANDSVCFNILSTDANAGQNLSLMWNNGISGGTFNSAGSPHPTGTFCWKPGTSDISTIPRCFTVRVSDDACPVLGANTYSYCITVTGIVVNAGPDQNIACSDFATITANASGGNPPYTYLWSNGFTNPTQTVPVGTYIVTVSDGNCSSTDTVNVVSAFQPTAAFTWAGGCAGGPVSFTDNSTTQGGFQSWTWIFGDGTQSNQQNPVHTYPGNGTYNVSLVVENIYGCIDTITMPVVIAPNPVPSFSADTVCAGSLINFNNTSTPAGVSWNWTFSNGASSSAQDPAVVLGPAGTYAVTLIVTDSLGCADTLTQNVTVNPQPTAGFTSSVTNGCQNTPIVFTNTSTGNPLSWSWSFGDGSTSILQNPTHTFPNSGSFSTNLIVTNSFGCSDTVQQPVFVNGPPLANAGPDVTICLGSNATITANGGATYNWTPGGMTGSTISVSPASDTTYYVTVTDGNGCTAIDSVNVFVNPLPIASVSPGVLICQGQSAVLVGSGGVSYSWNPSGNTNSTITVSPNTSTSYAVNVIDANNCQATAFVTVTVNPNPIISLSPGYFVCNGTSAILDPGTGGSMYLWSTGQTSQAITVNNQGVYTVTVTNTSGCTSTASTQVTVGGQVISNNNSTAICQGQTATLDAGYPGFTYQWSNGSTAQTITVSTAGAYSVTVTDPGGCTGTIANTVQVNPLPQAAFTPNDECINDTVFFSDLSSANGGGIVSWNWDFGDGNISYAQDPTHIYNNAGAYPITLTVTSDQGCTSTLTDTLNIYPLPQANFAFGFVCVGQPLPFTDQSTVAFGNIISWNWNFGDGDTSLSQNPQHAYANPGTYSVTLTVSTPGGCTGTITRIIQVYPQPNLSFSATPVNICQGSTVSINNTSTSTNGAINNWQWNFGNGNISNQQNPSVTFNTPGNFNITLIGTTTHGCSDTIQRSITVNLLPTADAGANTFVCIGNSVNLTASGGGTYLWSNGSTSQTISVAPVSAGYYYVTVTNAAGCSRRDSVNVGIRSLPNANAGPDQSICPGGSVTLNATGGGTYQWSPGGATTPSISVSPSSTTTYIVTVTGSNTCSRNDTVRVVVNPLPIANAGPDRAICYGTTTSITANGGSTYYWAHNGATASTVYVNPVVTTSYVVTATNAAGCSARDTVNITINPSPTVNGSNAFFCTGYSAVLNAGNPGQNYLWAPGGEATQNITVSSPGLYSVVVTNAFGCQGSGNFNVVEGGTGLNSTPVNVVSCQGTNVVLDAGNSGLNYQWSTGSNSQTINVSNSGSYSVTITDPSGCSTTFVNNVTLHPAPVVNFTGSSVCYGSATTFNNLSTISSGTINTWNWTFGGGQLSNLQQPSVLFSAPGVYPVSLIAVSGFGCTDSASGNVTVEASPLADFSAPQVCNGLPTAFTDLSSVAPGSVSSWSWNFGDGQLSAAQNPQHTYSSDGVYNVTLVVATIAGCADTLIRSVQVNPVPQPNFSASDVCEGDTVRFFNTSLMPNGQISDLDWSFGDGFNSGLSDPVHVYAGSGTYSVTLTVGSDLSCFATKTQPVNVNERPDAAFTAPNSCFGDGVVFNDQSTIGSGSVQGWLWEFGDGAFSPLPAPSHQYATPGIYTVTLVATSDKGCTDSASQQTTINALPAAGFTTSNACLGSSVQFTDTSVGNSINNWAWNFGDGTNSAAQQPSHTYASTGTYNVQLVTTDANGCSDTVTAAVNVFPVPLADFSFNNVCLNSPTAFADQSQITGGGIFSYAWDFGDSTIDTLAFPQHTFTQDGIFNVSLTVTTLYGCSASVTQQVTVHPSPLPLFTATDVCLNEPVQMVDQSTISSGSITAWNWLLESGVVSTAQNPTHFYNNPGVYPVTLEVTSVHGCRNSIADSVEIFAPPTPQPFAGTGCVGDNIAFTDTSTGSNNTIVSYNWVFGNGISDSSPNPSLSFNTAGPQTIILTTENSNGCRASATIVFNVSPLPVAGFTSGTGCANTALQFTNTSTISSGIITGYNWNFGDSLGGTSGLENPFYSYAQPGSYTVTLIVSSSEGCSDTITGNIVINPLPVAAFTAMNVNGCGPITVQFTDSSFIATGNVVAWSWDFGDGGTSAQQNPAHTYQYSGNYNVSLTVTSDSGCTHTITINNVVTVYPGPLADFEPEPASQTILNPNFSFINLTSGGLNYYWTFGDGGNSTQFEPQHSYADTGTYVVTLWVTNAYGCRDSAQHPVRVEPIFSWWIPNAFTPNGDGNNEGFNVTGEYIADVKLSIFNRWGAQIFYSEGAQNRAWDGSVQGEPQPAQEGVYVYRVIVTDVWGKNHEKVGHVSLVR